MKFKISAFSILVVFLAVALAGIAFLPLLPVKLAPSDTLPRLTVQFNMAGSSSRVVEMQATSLLESMLCRIRGVKSISSTSGNGWGTISLAFDRHTNTESARFEASAIVRQAWSQLPESVSYPSITMQSPDDKSNGPFLTYTLNAPASAIVIQRYAEREITRRLSHIPGIYRIQVSGATPTEYRLEYDASQLSRLGIGLEEIRSAIGKHYNREFLGTAIQEETNGEQKRWIRLALSPEGDNSQFDPSAITVADRWGALVRLDQLVKVTHREETPRGYFRINGLNSVYISFVADEHVNQLELGNRIADEIASFEKGLPSGYELHKRYDATEYIRKELQKVYVRTFLTILILLLFVLLISRSLRYLLLIVLSLLVNLSIAFIFYYLAGLEIQLYSLAGITISLSLVIDNTIVMADHIRIRRNRKAFLAILAATLTTIGALVIIFFLDESLRLNLQDFAAVVIINLAVSLLIALFFVPAHQEKLGLVQEKQSPFRKRATRRLTLLFSHYYRAQIKFLSSRRKSAVALLVLAFGLPLFLLPDKIEPEGNARLTLLGEYYNKLAGSDLYKSNVKPVMNIMFGGTLRLFVEKVYEGSYFSRKGETVLTITASMPNGTTLSQMNSLVEKMEAYLTTYDGIRQFQTSVHSARQAQINVYFTPQSEKGGFPYQLKSEVITKAFQLGGGSWGVYGLQDQGFSNDVRETAGSSRIELYGYNYDELYAHAEALRDTLLGYRRIKEVLINSQYSWWKDDYKEFVFDLDRKSLSRDSISPGQLFSSFSPLFGHDLHVATLYPGADEQEKVKLFSRQASTVDVWGMQHIPQGRSARAYKMNRLAKIEKQQVAQEVVKVDQQYRLCLQYEYIGSSSQAAKIQERVLKQYNKTLPMGYSAKSVDQRGGWNNKSKGQYLLLLLIIAIIFFTTSILFNSLRQPLAVICVIPISYIGVFLTFYLFKLNFDQGGFASFILLCGITVNASIYILNEYNRLNRTYPFKDPVRVYLKAWNAKITPIFLTVVSTILGFIPFLIGSDKEAFWFPLAAGTIGGLIFSVIGIYLFLPIFTINLKSNKKQ
ncbi:MAG: efflux RND transporter permease subunit [Bacteroidales bacterium]